MKSPLVSIIVVTINTPNLTRSCLKSVLKNTTPSHELIVINNSRAKTIRKCLREFRGIQIIQNPKNLGYAKAANQGSRASFGKYRCFLNSDTLVPPRWLERLLDSARKPRVGAVGPNRVRYRLFKAHPEHPHVGQTLTTLIDQKVRRMFKGRFRSAVWLSGFCLMIPKVVMNRVGLFDERFYLGWEDVDYACRLRLHGHRLVEAQSLFVYHQGNGSIPLRKRIRLARKAKEQFFKKWTGRS